MAERRPGRTPRETSTKQVRGHPLPWLGVFGAWPDEDTVGLGLEGGHPKVGVGG